MRRGARGGVVCTVTVDSRHRCGGRGWDVERDMMMLGRGKRQATIIQADRLKDAKNAPSGENVVVDES